MCRLLGIKNFEYDRHKGLVESFIGLGKTGCVLAGDPPGHADGWGLAWYEGGESRLLRSAGSIVEEGDRVLGTLAKAGGSKVMILHLRKSAWPRTTTVENAHPFMLDDCVFAHNGTVRDYKPLLAAITVDNGRPLEVMLDTEVFFLYAMSLRSPGLKEGFLRAVEHIRAHHTYSALNCLFSDGAALYAYRDYTKYPEYYTLFRAQDGEATIVSSEALSPSPAWVPLGNGELLSV